MTQQLDYQSVLDSLLAGGRELAKKGEDYAAKQLDVSDDPESRANLRKGMLGGAVGASVLAVLLGTQTGRRLASTGLAVGGLATLGKLAYDKWQENQPDADAGEPPVHELSGAKAEERAKLLVSAMIAAAKADGHIDETERQAIHEKLSPLGEETTEFIFKELGKPLDPEVIASQAHDPQTKAEVFAVSVLICGDAGPKERTYLDRLANALGMDAHARSGIEDALHRAA